MSVERVKAYLSRWQLDTAVLEMPDSTATVQEAAKALGTEPARIAKTLSFQDAGNGLGAIILVAAGDAKIDNPKFKVAFGQKPKMLSFEEVTEKTGFQVGGVCPFALPEGVRVYLDVSLKRFESVYPACGSLNSAIQLALEQLEMCTPCMGWVDVCKGWQPEDEA